MTNLALFGSLGMGEILLILLVLLLLFGARKLPDLARSMGSSINEFKRGLKDGDTPSLPDASKDKDAKRT